MRYAHRSDCDDRCNGDWCQCPCHQEAGALGHPYQPTAWPDTCGYQYSTGWPCGYAEAEHAERLEGASGEVRPDG